MPRSEQFNLKTKFTRDQYDWIKDVLTSLMLWFQYQEDSFRKMKLKIQERLEEVDRVGYQADEDDKGT